MRFRRFLFVILATSFFFAAGQASARDYNRAGVYFGVNGAYGIDLFGDELRGAFGVPADVVSFGNSGGLNARLGGRLLSFLAFEAQYEWMDGIPVNLAGTEVAKFKPHTVTGNLKLYIPISVVQPYILAGAGVGIWSVEVSNPAFSAFNQSHTGFAARLGAGVDIYPLTEKLAINVEGAGVLNTTSFSGLTQDLSGFYYFSVSAGLIYRF